jgi:hypothetical protein
MQGGPTPSTAFGKQKLPGCPIGGSRSASKRLETASAREASSTFYAPPRNTSVAEISSHTVKPVAASRTHHGSRTQAANCLEAESPGVTEQPGAVARKPTIFAYKEAFAAAAIIGDVFVKDFTETITRRSRNQFDAEIARHAYCGCIEAATRLRRSIIRLLNSASERRHS